MGRILIAGCGGIGAATGRLLTVDGHEVVGLKRHPPTGVDPLKYIKADLTCPDDLEGLDTCFDLVIYILTPDDRSERSYRYAFDFGVNNLLKVFSRNKGTRFLFVSSTSVYGQVNGEWVDEESVTEPEKITGQIILQAEKHFLSHGNENCIVRFSGIYGHSRSHLLDTVAKGGKAQYKPPYYTNRIYRGDCVSVLRFMANKMLAGIALAPVYLASDDDPAPKWDVYNYLAGKLGIERPEKETLPHGCNQNKRCSNKRLKKLGYKFIYKSYRDGYGFIKRLEG